MKKLLILSGLLMSGTVLAQTNTIYGSYAAASATNSNAGLSIFGYQNLYACQYCYGVSSFGTYALRVASGNYNTVMGYYGMYNTTSGYNNTAIGALAGYNNGTGGGNVYIGFEAAYSVGSGGANNVIISNLGKLNDNNVIRIGTQGQQTFTQIAGIYGRVIKTASMPVVVNAQGQLGVTQAAAAGPLVSQADIITLRNDLVSAKNMIYSLQREVAVLKVKANVK